MEIIYLFIRLIVWFLLMSRGYSEDFWNHAMRTHYEQRVSLFNSLEVEDDAMVMLGNSITASCNWSELFNNDRIINRGIGGDTTDGILKRIDFLKNCNPDAVFLMIGINDLSQGKTPDEIIINYERIVESILQNNIGLNLFIQSVLPINKNLFMLQPNYDNGKINILNQMIKKLEGKRVKYINLYDKFLDSEGNLKKEYSNDGLHLTGLGYLQWREILIDTIDHFK
ncbi:MAG: hypothetical protein CMG74_12180 [Candidatus Marinimicrobia bacterium]|nr:hypothetical protein [Candidatus Neomarinimicrobiota bacterium]|tara:strand:+ start:1067 stop:1744 length:678 start_codon:yes stop_codon:yes gene_type:complete